MVNILLDYQAITAYAAAVKSNNLSKLNRKVKKFGFYSSKHKMIPENW
jgi:hypothetical protein